MDSTPIHSIDIVEEKCLQNLNVEEQGKVMITLLHPKPKVNLVIDKEEREEQEKEDKFSSDASGPHVNRIKEVVQQRTF